MGSNPLKVLIIAFMAHGAAGQYTAQLANALSEISETTVIIPDYANPQYFNKNIKLLTLSIPLGLAAATLKTLNPSFSKLLLGVVADEKPDVVHVVVEYRFWFPYAFLLHRKYPMVKAMPARSSMIANTLAALIQYVNNSLLAKFADKVIVHSAKVKGCRLISKLPDYKVEIVPHGEFAFFAQSGEVVEKGGRTILFFGRIVPYKGIEYLIQAGKIIEKQIADVSITIAGEGDWTNYEKQIVGDNHFIVHNRFIPDNEVAQLFQKASLVVLPYTYGSQTGVVSIAATFKKPAIVTDVGNFAEIVEHGRTGLVIPPRDANALAEAIIKLLADDKLRQQMGNNAYNLVKERFSWDGIAKRTLEVYEKAIKRRRTL